MGIVTRNGRGRKKLMTASDEGPERNRGQMERQIAPAANGLTGPFDDTMVMQGSSMAMFVASGVGTGGLPARKSHGNLRA
jgi:hypothetical protein